MKNQKRHIHFAYVPVVSDEVPLVVSRQLLQTFAQELRKLEPESQKEVAHYALTQIQPRVVSFEEQSMLASFARTLTSSEVRSNSTSSPTSTHHKIGGLQLRLGRTMDDDDQLAGEGTGDEEKLWPQLRRAAGRSSSEQQGAIAREHM